MIDSTNRGTARLIKNIGATSITYGSQQTINTTGINRIMGGLLSMGKLMGITNRYSFVMTFNSSSILTNYTSSFEDPYDYENDPTDLLKLDEHTMLATHIGGTLSVLSEIGKYPYRSGRVKSFVDTAQRLGISVFNGDKLVVVYPTGSNNGIQLKPAICPLVPKAIAKKAAQSNQYVDVYDLR